MRTSVTTSLGSRSGAKKRKEKIGNRHDSLAIRTSRYNRRTECKHGSGMIVSRIAVREIACQRRHVSHLRIGNHRDGVRAESDTSS